MEAKFTKGPWENWGGDNYSCELNAGDCLITLDRRDKNTDVCLIERSEMEANAKLIAAAPEMYALLIEAEEALRREHCHGKANEISFLLTKINS